MGSNAVKLTVAPSNPAGPARAAGESAGVPLVSATTSPAKRPAQVSDADRRRAALREKIGTLLVGVALPAITFAVIIGLWAFIHSELRHDLPAPAQVWDKALSIFSHPFYNNGPNDKGIGWQLLYSLGRVMGGFGLAVLVGVPTGLLMGMSTTFRRAWQPLIQILRPVSPLAWLPIGLLLFKAVNPSAIFVIFITCMWPTLLNTIAGVQAVPRDYMNVAAVLRLGRFNTLRKIVLPAARPYIITGMRLSLGIAWMVIVAAEMLTGGIGIGFYVWDEWNNLSVSSIIVAIVVIGLVGMALEALMNWVQSRFDYGGQ